MHRYSESVSLLQKMIELKATPDEFAHYEKAPGDFDPAVIKGFVNKKIMDLDRYHEMAQFLDMELKEALDRSVEFYTLTYKRDLAFVRNVLEKMDSENLREAVLVTGGYHTPNLKDLLKWCGVSYVSISPVVAHETDLERYQRILLGGYQVPIATKEPSISAAAARRRDGSVTDLPAAGAMPLRLRGGLMESGELVLERVHRDLLDPQTREALAGVLAGSRSSSDLENGQNRQAGVQLASLVKDYYRDPRIWNTLMATQASTSAMSTRGEPVLYEAYVEILQDVSLARPIRDYMSGLLERALMLVEERAANGSGDKQLRQVLGWLKQAPDAIRARHVQIHLALAPRQFLGWRSRQVLSRLERTGPALVVYSLLEKLIQINDVHNPRYNRIQSRLMEHHKQKTAWYLAAFILERYPDEKTFPLMLASMGKDAVMPLRAALNLRWHQWVHAAEMIQAERPIEAAFNEAYEADNGLQRATSGSLSSLFLAVKSLHPEFRFLFAEHLREWIGEPSDIFGKSTIEYQKRLRDEASAVLASMGPGVLELLLSDADPVNKYGIGLTLSRIIQKHVADVVEHPMYLFLRARLEALVASGDAPKEVSDAIQTIDVYLNQGISVPRRMPGSSGNVDPRTGSRMSPAADPSWPLKKAMIFLEGMLSIDQWRPLKRQIRLLQRPVWRLRSQRRLRRFGQKRPDILIPILLEAFLELHRPEEPQYRRIVEFLYEYPEQTALYLTAFILKTNSDEGAHRNHTLRMMLKSMGEDALDPVRGALKLLEGGDARIRDEDGERAALLKQFFTELLEELLKDTGDEPDAEASVQEPENTRAAAEPINNSSAGTSPNTRSAKLSDTLKAFSINQREVRLYGIQLEMQSILYLAEDHEELIKYELRALLHRIGNNSQFDDPELHGLLEQFLNKLTSKSSAWRRMLFEVLNELEPFDFNHIEHAALRALIPYVQTDSEVRLSIRKMLYNDHNWNMALSIDREAVELLQRSIDDYDASNKGARLGHFLDADEWLMSSSEDTVEISALAESVQLEDLWKDDGGAERMVLLQLDSRHTEKVQVTYRVILNTPDLPAKEPEEAGRVTLGDFQIIQAPGSSAPPSVVPSMISWDISSPNLKKFLEDALFETNFAGSRMSLSLALDSPASDNYLPDPGQTGQLVQFMVGANGLRLSEGQMPVLWSADPQYLSVVSLRRQGEEQLLNIGATEIARMNPREVLRRLRRNQTQTAINEPGVDHVLRSRLEVQKSLTAIDRLHQNRAPLNISAKIPLADLDTSDEEALALSLRLRAVVLKRVKASQWGRNHRFVVTAADRERLASVKSPSVQKELQDLLGLPFVFVSAGEAAQEGGLKVNFLVLDRSEAPDLSQLEPGAANFAVQRSDGRTVLDLYRNIGLAAAYLHDVTRGGRQLIEETLSEDLHDDVFEAIRERQSTPVSTKAELHQKVLGQTLYTFGESFKPIYRMDIGNMVQMIRSMIFAVETAV
ncbi:MAG: hypothetical protein HQL11_02815 [Candidatus Omnitrophica bacterium]|nr:hypothetical protein [Candidatus Omnitrophota bacterium]